MNKKEINYYLRILEFLSKLHFFSSDFLKYIENNITFSGVKNNNQKVCNITKKKNKIDKISLVLPYPNNFSNFLLCLDGFSEAYFYYLIKKGKDIDQIFLEVLKASIKRIYILENFSEKSICSFNKEQLNSLDKLTDSQLIGLALSFEISNGYEKTGCFLLPDEYFFDANKAKEYCEIELQYILSN